jgi:ribosome-associated protein
MEESKSKSQKKRDAAFLQKIGVELTQLSLDKLNNLPLSPSLKQVIVDAKSLKSHGAIRRQAQLIGKLMRAQDTEELLQAYENMKAENSAQTAGFH